MRRLALAFALALLAAPLQAGEHGGKAAPPVKPLEAPSTPFSDMMIDVQRLQARMAQGDRDAYAEQRARMKAIGAALSAAKPEAFKERAERDAVVVYLLSGGQPKDIAKILDRGDFPADERNLLRGAAGYAAGKEAEAEKLLAYHPREESLRLGGQLAYAQSVLLTPKDAKKALDLLDVARLLAPGTLIEEAALRREILLVGDLRQSERVAFLARQYVERFGKSIYADDFVRTLATAAIRFDLTATLTDLAKFSSLLRLLPPEKARAFLLEVARASLLKGRFDVAEDSSKSALALTNGPGPDEARARLYHLASTFPHMPQPDAQAALAAVGRDKLKPADRDILAAAEFVNTHLYEMPPYAAYEDNWREASVAAARSPDLPQNNLDPADVTIRRAAAALEAAQAIGKEPPR